MKQFLSIVVGVIIIGAVAFFTFRSYCGEEKEQEEMPVVSSSPVAQSEFTQIAPSTLPEEVVSSASPAVADVVHISIDDEGFRPETVDILIGTTVVFTNNGQALHWPASAPHPTHTGLPGFDAEKGLATGETYSFTFSELGTFGMHDHLNAKIKGSIKTYGK